MCGIQVKLADESSSSLDIIRVEDTTAVVEEPQEEEREEEGQDKEEKENKMTSKLLPKKRTKLQKQTERGSTPVFKVPRPLAHHSTPSGDRLRGARLVPHSLPRYHHSGQGHLFVSGERGGRDQAISVLSIERYVRYSFQEEDSEKTSSSEEKGEAMLLS